MLADFKNSFAVMFCRQIAVVWLLNISPHLNCVATLPCET